MTPENLPAPEKKQETITVIVKDGETLYGILERNIGLKSTDRQKKAVLRNGKPIGKDFIIGPGDKLIIPVLDPKKNFNPATLVETVSIDSTAAFEELNQEIITPLPQEEPEEEGVIKNEENPYQLYGDPSTFDNIEFNKDKDVFPNEPETAWDKEWKDEDINGLRKDAKFPREEKFGKLNFRLDGKAAFVQVPDGWGKDQLIAAINKTKIDGYDFSHIDKSLSNVQGMNIHTTQLRANMWVPVYFEIPKRKITDKQLFNYCNQGINEILAGETPRDKHYQAVLKEIINKAGGNEKGKEKLLRFMFAIAKKESGTAPEESTDIIKELTRGTEEKKIKEQELIDAMVLSDWEKEKDTVGKMSFHNWEPTYKAFSLSMFHIVIKKTNGEERSGFDAAKKLQMSPGQMMHPKNAAKLFIGFYFEKFVSSHLDGMWDKVKTEDLPKDGREYKKRMAKDPDYNSKMATWFKAILDSPELMAINHNGKDWENNNPTYRFEVKMNLKLADQILKNRIRPNVAMPPVRQ